MTEGKASMDDSEMLGHLNSVGKARFADFYEVFADLSLSCDEVADIIVRARPGLDWGGARGWRCRSARRIIAAGRGESALQVVAASRADRESRERARRILQSAGKL